MHPLAFTYPDLPIVPRKDDILKALRESQALVVQGGTGSGKTTQLPKFLLEAGYSDAGLIGVTQPRRIAALSIADRLRQETGQPSLIGAKIRFLEDVPAGARVKVMTDGILLQEFKRDPLLRRYACIVLDEAHERSLNVDILLGIFKTLLPRRPEFRLVVTSATLDAERFAKFLGGTAPGGAAPVVEVEGRQYPVTLEYWEPNAKGGVDEDDEDGAPANAFPPVEAAAMAIRDLQRRRPDNLLAFLPTEKEINELHRELERDLGKHFLILPLYSRLGPADQRRVFQDSHQPKIILATNIAETSLTIPGIGYVVDTGLARISRYHPQTKIQGLPIERISQASAKQRAGRAGRVKPGVCVRLFSEEDYSERRPFTEPEILRSNLANVVLHLLALGLPVGDFPFPDPPSPAALKGAFRQLHELGAVDDPGPEGRITAEGIKLSRLPVDVALGRILLKAQELGVLQPAMVIAAGLTISDPRITPREEPERGKAVGLHRRFEDPTSDFIGLLILWKWIQKHLGDGLSQRRLRHLCVENFLSYTRVREWMDLVEQFRRLLKVTADPAAFRLEEFGADALHKSILAGFLPFLARRKPEDTSYRLAGDKEAHIHPGSALNKKRPEWIVAGEVRQTSRVFIYRAAEIKPAWVEEIAPEACKRSYLQIAWNPERGFVEALERVTYKGFTLRQDRRVNYESVAPEDCAEMFWREGVVRDGQGAPFPFRDHNRKVLETLAGLENKARQRGLVPDEDALVQWYRQRAPEVTSRVRLERFLKAPGSLDLRFSTRDWAGEAAGAEALFPDSLETNGHTYPVSYRFDYGDPLDGISIESDPEGLGRLGPSLLAKRLPGWKLWIREYFLEKMGAKARQAAAEKAGDIDSAWAEALTQASPDHSASGATPSAAEALARALAARPEVSGQGFAFPSTWPAHLAIHIFVKSLSGRRFLLHVDPAHGDAEFFAGALRLLFGERAWLKPWPVLAPALLENHGMVPPPLAWRGLYFGPSPLGGFAPTGHGPDWPGGAGFFLDGDEALFHRHLAATLARAAAGTKGPAKGGPDLEAFFQKRWKFLLEAWACPEVRRQDTAKLLAWLCESWLPKLAREALATIPPTDLSFRLDKDLPLPKAGLPKTVAPVKSLAALGKAVVRETGPLGWAGPALCLGAALHSWPLFIRWWQWLARPMGETAPLLDKALAEVTAVPGWEAMLASPFHAAWLAKLLVARLPSPPPSEGPDGESAVDSAAAPPFPEGSLTVPRRRFDLALEKQEALRKAAKEFHTRFCAGLAALGQSVAGLPKDLRDALDGLAKPGSWSGKALAQLDLELHLLKIRGRAGTAGKPAGAPAGKDAEAAGEAQGKLLKDLSGRFKRL